MALVGPGTSKAASARAEVFKAFSDYVKSSPAKKADAKKRLNSAVSRLGAVIGKERRSSAVESYSRQKKENRVRPVEREPRASDGAADRNEQDGEVVLDGKDVLRELDFRKSDK
jgi:hypothetical protein